MWTVSSLPNGDIVSGCSDHVVRVFSTSEERWLPDADLKTYDEQVANQTLPSQQIGDVKKSDLPGLEALEVPGESFRSLPASAFVTDGESRQEAWRDKDGQERGCCRSTPGRASDQHVREGNLTWITAGRRFDPAGQGRDCR